ncbi:hypothetical protein GCM10023165_52010 [Variovorax defluvii]|uniref:LapA family protein n=1 Tax=Variovorax defluvii TaxID=913761 RepID=A0ABP8IFC3_9BURK
MDSRVTMLQRNRRLLFWTAVVATMLALALLAADLAFPPEALTYATASNADLSAFQMRDFQLLMLVTALVVSVAAFAGAGIAALGAWMARRKDKDMEEQVPSPPIRRRRRKAEPALAREPANERIAALRAVIAPADQAPGAKA